MLHVGMNIEDKEKLAAEVARVLQPGSAFGISDGSLWHDSAIGGRVDLRSTVSDR